MNLPRKHVPLLAFGVLFAVLIFLAVTQFENESVDFFASSGSQAWCNIGVVSLSGQLATYDSDESIDSLRIAQTIRSLQADSSKEALVLLINSFGGSVAAAEEIAGAIESLDVPSVALIREYGLSGGYWVAASTNHIIALSTSFIGSVGVTSSYLEETALNVKEGFTYREITSGEYKDVGNVNKTLSAADRQFLQGNVDSLFKIFLSVVKGYRGLTDAQIAQISDGKYYIAQKALEMGLIDEVGGIPEVKAYLAGQLSVPPENLLLCEPEILGVSTGETNEFLGF